MQQFRVWWNSFKTVAIWFSFILNLVTLIVLILVIMQIFKIKNGILEPLVDGLHRDFAGLDEAIITRTINVDDTIPVQFDLPLNQQTNVVLTDNVPIVANASFTLPGGGGVINGRVDIVLPKDLVLPVQLSMVVPVDTTIPVQLPVAVEIPLNETQLHYPFKDMRDLLEPYVRVMDNLPDDWDEVPDFTVNAVQGDVPNLLTPKEENIDPWPGTPTPTPLPGTDGTPRNDGWVVPGPTMTFTPYPTLTPSPQ